VSDEGSSVLTFGQRLSGAVKEAGSPLCVGLDPHGDRTPPGQIVEACRRVIELTARYAAAFKPNSAFFEAAGTNAFVHQGADDDTTVALATSTATNATATMTSAM